VDAPSLPPFRNPFQKHVEAYSKLPNLMLTMTPEQKLADWDAKQKQRGNSDSLLHVQPEIFVSRVTGRSCLI
jgi:hypothetical protein